MRIAIAGSRDFKDLEWVDDFFNHLPDTEVIIVSGGARGVDQRAESAARQKGIECNIYLPDWKQFGKGAGNIRNRTIIDNSDILVAFWDGVSRGTEHAIGYARYKNKPTFVIVDLETKKEAFDFMENLRGSK